MRTHTPFPSVTDTDTHGQIHMGEKITFKSDEEGRADCLWYRKVHSLPVPGTKKLRKLRNTIYGRVLWSSSFCFVN